MIWDIIIKKLEDEGLGVVGESLFEGGFPGNVAVGIGLFEPLGGIAMDPNLPDYYKPELRVIVRHNRVGPGKDLAKRVMKALTIAAEESYPATAERGAVTLKVFYPLALPIQFPALEGKGTEWSINFRTTFTLRD